MARGSAPDAVMTAEDTGGYGRPWPFMIFKNMKVLGVKSVTRVLKAGDTVSDIEEALAAGVIPVGIVEGSSVMGLSRREWDVLDEEERAACREKTRAVFARAGARYVIDNLAQLPALVRAIEVR